MEECQKQVMEYPTSITLAPMSADVDLRKKEVGAGDSREKREQGRKGMTLMPGELQQGRLPNSKSLYPDIIRDSERETRGKDAIKLSSRDVIRKSPRRPSWPNASETREVNEPIFCDNSRTAVRVRALRNMYGAIC